jgi:hypothetical protein
MMWSKRRNSLGKKTEKGQGFLELGLSLVFLMILLAAVIDLGWAFFTLIALRDASQEAASVAAICPNSEARIRTRLKAAATSPIDLSRIEDDKVELCIFDPLVAPRVCKTSGFEVGDSAEVKITYMHDIMVPMVGSFIGSQSYPLVVNSVDTILTTDCRVGP